jgi:TFIIF-interacting CTD phosphatase-like protein
MHLKIQDNPEIKDVYVSIRPYAIEMLKKLKKHAELIVFTAGHKTYADSIVASLN